jgi:hypothetical protein
MSVKIENVSITVPVTTADVDGYKSRYVTTTTFKLKQWHINTLHRIKGGLAATGARLQDGRLVDSATMTLSYILEQVEAQLPVVQPPAVEPEKNSEPQKNENSKIEKTKIENSKISDLEI